MTGILLKAPPREGLFEHLPWRRNRIAIEEKEFWHGGPQVLLLRVPPHLAERPGGWRKLDRMLHNNDISALLCSAEILSQSPPEAQEIMARYRSVTPTDYAGTFLKPMLSQAAAFCPKPLQKRSLCIVDQSGERLEYELLLRAAQLAGRVSILTDRPTTMEPLLERLFDQTGLPVQCLRKNRAEADLVLLLQHTGLSVRAMIVLDLCAAGGERAHVLERRIFRSLTLKLPPAIAANLPVELTAAERSCLMMLLLDRSTFESLRPDRLL